MAAKIVEDLFTDPNAYTQERASEHANTLTGLIEVSCTCNQERCASATSYVLGMAEGLRMGSVNAMSAALYDQLRARRDNAPLLPSEIKLVVQMPDTLKVAQKPSAGIVVEYGADGKISGTRPRD
jgi:hypothetical protein